MIEPIRCEALIVSKGLITSQCRTICFFLPDEWAFRYRQVCPGCQRSIKTWGAK